jgi:hypothetical protein
MRKLFIAAGCCGLIFFAGWAFGQQVLDASRWNEIGRQDDYARMMYVLGYTQGYEDGDSAMEKVAFVLTKGNPPDSATKALLTPQVTRIAEVEGRGKNHGITVAKVTDAVSTFYTDYRNAPVCWNAAVQFSIWSLNGDAPTEQELDAARKRGGDGGCK